MMRLFMILRVAFKALGRNKLRTALTMLGMIIGVAAVIAMVALGVGAQEGIEASIQSAGTNLITVYAGSFSMGGQRQGAGAAITLSLEDAVAIRDEVSGIQYMSVGVRSQQQVVVSGQNWRTNINGVDIEWPQIRSWPVKYGSFFSQQDVTASARVAVLGLTVATNLFGEDADPSGEIIRVKDQPFKVIGVMTGKGASTSGENLDDSILIPYTTCMKKLMGTQNIQNMTISAASADEVALVKDRVSTVLRMRHRIFPGDTDDFMLFTADEIMAMRTETTRTMTALLSGIAGVSLLVGGIGIMNIMLVSVTERTREIGLRMAIGAKGRDVLLQFLVEAVVLSLVGGGIGIGCGFGLAKVVTQVWEYPTTISPDSIVLAFAFSAVTGIFFGFYPATKAAKLDPIEALRFE
jgi:putative ABC transport system permease protein